MSYKKQDDSDNNENKYSNEKNSTPCHVVIYGRVSQKSARAEEVSRMGSSGTPVKGNTSGIHLHFSGIHLQHIWNYIDVQVEIFYLFIIFNSLSFLNFFFL